MYVSNVVESEYLDSAIVSEPPVLNRPKLLIGITVDQMRYDYLQRFEQDFLLDAGGFPRLIFEGLSNPNTHYNYVPTYTGPGHASIFTGTTPATHGIIANDWYDKKRNALQYCAKDTLVLGIGTLSDAGKMSPIHLLSTTIGDELKLSSNGKSKVIGISLKDRGAILPAGRSADAAYWYIGGKEDVWATSSWYGMKELPQWVQDFNAKGYGAKSLKEDWNLFYPDSIYNESLPDNNPYEAPFKGLIKPVFPYKLSELTNLNNQYDLMKATPLGNTMTVEFAKAAIEGERLGQQNGVVDMLCMSFSATDYVGHQFGPHSRETQDTYLRLNRDISNFIDYLDTTIGRDSYLIFLTADHGAANNPAMMMDRKLAAGNFVSDKLEEFLENKLIEKYGAGDWIINESNQNVFLNREWIEQKKLSLKSIQQEVAIWACSFEGVQSAYTHAELSYSIAREDFAERLQRGFDQHRSGDVIYVLKPGWIEYGKQGTTHGSGYEYDTHVPFILFGNIWNCNLPEIAFNRIVNESLSITDIAPIISDLLNINRPSGCLNSPDKK
jgi:predicted AlkP superfamily pyrophosphatase or phosphodiesterase